MILASSVETPRQQWIGTRLKHRMQTHGFLEENGYDSSDNVDDLRVGSGGRSDDGGSSKEERVSLSDSFWPIISKISISNSSPASPTGVTNTARAVIRSDSLTHIRVQQPVSQPFADVEAA